MAMIKAQRSGGCEDGVFTALAECFTEGRSLASDIGS